MAGKDREPEPELRPCVACKDPYRVDWYRGDTGLCGSCLSMRAQFAAAALHEVTSGGNVNPIEVAKRVVTQADYLLHAVLKQRYQPVTEPWP